MRRKCVPRVCPSKSDSDHDLDERYAGDDDFENDDDVIADHLIYRDENKFESTINKIAWDPPVKRAKNVSAFSYSCWVQDPKKLTHRVPLTLGISIFCF